MASLTRAEIADRALEALGVKAAGQSAIAEDSNRALEAVDAVHAMLRKEGNAPFATSAVPEWAQEAMIHIIAMSLVPSFGVGGERLSTISAMAQKGRIDLARQVAGARQPMPIRSTPF